MHGNIKWIDRVYNDTTEINLKEIKNTIERMNQNIQDAGKLISGFLKYIQEEECKLERSELLPIIEKIKDELTHASNNTISIEVTCENNLPLIKLDEILFQSVIEEIIMNAQFHTPRHCSITIDITRTKKQRLMMPEDAEHTNFIKIDIQDNGPGIPDNLKTKIFNLGFSTRSMGNGLGLALVKSDIEKHNGFISEIGKEGEGAIFRILLPI